MRRFGLGCLRYDPEQFGLMRVGAFLDAMAGYHEDQNERIKIGAELLRLSTAILWNIQVDKSHKLSPKQLMPLPWDEEKIKPVVISEEDYRRTEELFERILNGNSNNKP